MSLIEKTVLEIKGAWGLIFNGIESPADSQIAMWILDYGYKDVKAAAARAGRKFRKLQGDMDREYLEKYVSAILSKTVKTN